MNIAHRMFVYFSRLYERHLSPIYPIYPIAAALMAKMGYTRDERPRVKAECLRLLARLRLDDDRMRLIGGFVETYLELDEAEEARYNEIVEELPMPERKQLQEVMTVWERRGLEKGLEQGLERGREEGRQGALRMLLLMLNHRFGEVSEADLHVLERQPAPVLEALARVAFEAETCAAWRTSLHNLIHDTN